MGSTVEVHSFGATDAALGRARERIATLEASWSRFDAASELSRLNARSGGGPVRVGTDLLDAVDAALRLWRATDGCFDPTTLDAIVALGYDETFERVRNRPVVPDTAQQPAEVPGACGVVVDHEAGTITLPAGVRLDLGGLGKGRAADIVAAAMLNDGARGACVSVGGDVSIAGEAPPGGWPVHIADPFDPHLDRWVVPLVGGAVVQSSCLVRRWETRTGTRHHIIDPRTGTSASSGIVAAVVLADEAWWAEGVAKAAIVAGAVKGAAMVERLALGGWLVREDRCVIPVGSVRVRGAA